EQVAAHRVARLGAEAKHVSPGVVAGKRGQVDQCDRTQQPGSLPVLLHTATRADRGRAALDRAAVDADVPDPVELQREARVARELRGGRGRTRDLPSYFSVSHGPRSVTYKPRQGRSTSGRPAGRPAWPSADRCPRIRPFLPGPQHARRSVPHPTAPCMALGRSLPGAPSLPARFPTSPRERAASGGALAGAPRPRSFGAS